MIVFLKNVIEYLLENPVYGGFVGSLIAGLATGLGAIPVFFVRKVPQKVIDVLLGFSVGIMLAASFFSLIIPSLEIGGVIQTTIGVILGFLLIHLVNEYVPHEHVVKGVEGAMALRLKRIWLFTIAMAVHNFPEGLAVGVSFATGDPSEALAITTAIGVQNMPEGLAVALALISTLHYSAIFSFLVALATGLVEPIAGVLGALVINVFKELLPYLMSFAGGAMLYIVSNEIIPESHRLGHEEYASFGFIMGFIIMMIFDSIFTF